MANSRDVAALVGPALAAITASEALHLDIWRGVSPTLVYLNGCLLLVAGLAILRTHNVWTWRWPVLVTLIGWFAIAGGLYRTFAPNAPQPGQSAVTDAFLLALFSIGCFLSVKAYLPDRGQT